MKKIIFEGCGTAIVTPFTEEGVNFEAFKKLIEFQIENEVDAIIVCGTTGEASTMTTDEKKETIKFAIETIAKRTKVIVGTICENNPDSGWTFCSRMKTYDSNVCAAIDDLFGEYTKDGDKFKITIEKLED